MVRLSQGMLNRRTLHVKYDNNLWRTLHASVRSHLEHFETIVYELNDSHTFKCEEPPQFFTFFLKM